jgi:adenine-specific DNA-methyltransferase
MLDKLKIASHFDIKERAVVFEGDCVELLREIPTGKVQLVVTSPPYNIGKEYEKKLHLDHYVAQQRAVIEECVRVLHPSGSICWQVGNFVEDGAIIPLDTVLYPVFRDLGLKMRNRIIWHFEHGLHCSKRFSGRYEAIIWFTKGENYLFDLDPIRVPQKYPGKKHFKGPRAGQYSCNPLGKSPGDVWAIPNVKSNHVEKTDHPCQFPVELIERLVLSMTRENDWVFDPFLGVGTTIAAAIRHNRRGAGAETVQKYCAIAKERIQMAAEGTLRVRPMGRAVFDPKDAGTSLTTAPWKRAGEGNGKHQMAFFEDSKPYRSRK